MYSSYVSGWKCASCQFCQPEPSSEFIFLRQNFKLDKKNSILERHFPGNGTDGLTQQQQQQQTKEREKEREGEREIKQKRDSGMSLGLS